MTADLPEIKPNKELIRVGEGVIDFDVVVVGGGNAALCMIRRQKQVRPWLFSSVPQKTIGAVTLVTLVIFGVCIEIQKGVLTGSYDEDEFYDDLLKVTKGNTDEDLGGLRFVNQRHAMTGCLVRVVFSKSHYRDFVPFTYQRTFLGGK